MFILDSVSGQGIGESFPSELRMAPRAGEHADIRDELNAIFFHQRHEVVDCSNGMADRPNPLKVRAFFPRFGG